MSGRPPSRVKKSSALFTVLIVVVALGAILAGSGFTYAASQETHDVFCASCHTQPESTFYKRSTSSQPVDLASYHTTQKTRCIDCHSGSGIFGRMQAELLGARNAVRWYTNTATQPAKYTYPISDTNCLKCHQAVTQRGIVPQQTVTIPGVRGGGEGEGEGEGRNNHWHEFLARWQASDANAGSCASCHPGHSTGSSAQEGFQNPQTTQNTCNACHHVLRREGGGD